MGAQSDQPSGPPGEAPPRAAVLLVGDELLSGKIRDENGHFLAKAMRRRGIALVEIRTVSDAPRDIGHALLDLAARVPILFTSGGVGPTHDDRTLAAIAEATGRPLQRNATMERQLREYYTDRITDAALSMADLPEGTELCAGPGWPAMRLSLEGPPPCRVYILPGVPGLLRAKVERLLAADGELPDAGGWHLAEIHTSLEESQLAPLLDAVLQEFPKVEIGSYPRWSRGDDGRIALDVRVTLEGPVAMADDVQAAHAALQRRLPVDAIIPEAPAQA
ncbi:MAG: competence/damage-inducible protein A [Myxococcota bacterium]